MRPLATVRLVVQREAGDRLRNRTFLWSTGITLVLLVLGVVVPTLLGDEGPERYELGVVGEVPEGFGAALRDALGGRDGPSARLVALPDADAAATAVEDGEVDAALIDGRRLMIRGPALPSGLRAAVDDALRQRAVSRELARLGVGDDELAAAFGAHEPVEVVDTTGESDEGPDTGIVVAFAATILLFVAIQFNGNSLLTGAIEEKSSRVVEVLLAVVRPWQLLAAKLLALTALALGQAALFVGGVLGANAVVGAFEVPPATGPAAAVSLLMIVVGFTFYAALYTVAGSMASSVEDAQGTAGPLAFLTVAAYVVAVFAVIPAPGGTLARVLTYLPPTAPFTVPARVALGAIPGWQVVLAALVTLLGTVATVRLAGRLYAAAVLAGGKLTWRDVWRAEPVR